MRNASLSGCDLEPISCLADIVTLAFCLLIQSAGTRICPLPKQFMPCRRALTFDEMYKPLTNVYKQFSMNCTCCM